MNATLEPFLVLPEHRLPYEAAVCLAARRAPHLVYLHGPSGVGKSHLARVLEFQFRARHSRARVKCLLGGELAAHFVESAALQAVPLFQATFDDLDLLIVEDLQELEGHLQAQQQLQHLVDALERAGCRFLFTSVKPPGQLARFSRRLISRLRAGVVTSLGAVGPEGRLRLLRHWVETGAVRAAAPVLEVLAERLQRTPRELLAMARRLEELARQQRRPLTSHFAAELLAREPAAESLPLSAVCRAVARQYTLKVGELRGRPRSRRCTLPRQIAMYFAREHLRISLGEIGRYFGGRDHTTVMHACRRITQLAGLDARLARELAQLRAALEACG